MLRVVPLALDLAALQADQAVRPADATGAPLATIGSAAMTFIQGDTVVFRLHCWRAGSRVRLAADDQIAICGRHDADIVRKLYETAVAAGEAERNLGTETSPIWAYDIPVVLHTIELGAALASAAAVHARTDIQVQSSDGAATTWRIRPLILKEVYAGGEPPQPANPPYPHPSEIVTARIGIPARIGMHIPMGLGLKIGRGRVPAYNATP